MIDDQTLFGQNPKMKWLPWIGDNYQIGDGLMIIGESHYADESEGRLKHFDDQLMTRKCVEDMGVNNNKYRVNYYQSINRTLLAHNKAEVRDLWHKVAFMNLVQVPMRTTKQRPTRDDFDSGALVVVSALELLKPSACWVCGISMYDPLLRAFKSKKEQISIVKHGCEKKINGTGPRFIQVMMREGHAITMLISKHPSSHYSPDKWREFLFEKSEKLKAEFGGK